MMMMIIIIIGLSYVERNAKLYSNTHSLWLTTHDKQLQIEIDKLN